MTLCVIGKLSPEAGAVESSDPALSHECRQWLGEGFPCDRGHLTPRVTRKGDPYRGELWGQWSHIEVARLTPMATGRVDNREPCGLSIRLPKRGPHFGEGGNFMRLAEGIAGVRSQGTT